LLIGNRVIGNGIMTSLATVRAALLGAALILLSGCYYAPPPGYAYAPGYYYPGYYYYGPPVVGSVFVRARFR
jgi:hypothetical protein